MTKPIINGARLLERLNTLGKIGNVAAVGCTRLALTDEDRAARDLIKAWLIEAGASVHVDKIGNIYGVIEGVIQSFPIMTGSHIDTVTRAGKLDGCYGVIAGIEALQAISEAGLKPLHRIAVAIFSNEEGVRYSPDLLGSRVIAKDIGLEDALSIESRDGKTFGSELKRIGYYGDFSPWAMLPKAFIELHIEQGPLLEASGRTIGIVEGVQGHSWWQVVIEGCANHAGTTPMVLRKDAGIAAMKLVCGLEASASGSGLPTVSTIGTFTIEPGAINVVPGRARFTVDFRDADDAVLRKADALIQAEARKFEQQGFSVQLTSISRANSVKFDSELCNVLESCAQTHNMTSMRMVSGASHDAQMIATICPSAMLFVQSINGISHNPKEETPDADLVMGAQVLSDALWSLATTS